MKPGDQLEEFSMGDTITFNPYGTRLSAKVVSVSRLNTWGIDDGRVFYGIRGPGIVSTTTGLSIEQSRYFTPPKPIA